MANEIYVALITAGSILAVEVIRKFNFSKSTTRVVNAVEKNPKIEEILKGLENIIEVKRAVLVKVSNSGMKIMAGDSLYGTIVFPTEWKRTFDNQALDNDYINRIVAPLFKNRKVSVFKKDLSNGHLKTMFEVNGIEKSICSHILTTDEKLFFVQVDFITESVSEQTKDILRIAINDIKNLMK